MIILDVMSWPHFTQLNYIRQLPLDEQLKRYNYYLMEQQSLQMQMNMTPSAAGSGGSQPVTTPSIPSNCVEFTVDTTGGTEFSLDFNTTGPVNFTIAWGDGETYDGSGFGGYYAESHTYPEIGQQYVARICFDDPTIVTTIQFIGND